MMTCKKIAFILIYLGTVCLEVHAQINLFPNDQTGAKTVKVARSETHTFLVHIQLADTTRLYDLTLYTAEKGDAVAFKIDQSAYQFNRVLGKDTLSVTENYTRSLQQVINAHLYIPVWIRYASDNPFEDQTINLVVSDGVNQVAFWTFLLEKVTLNRDLVAGTIPQAKALTISPFKPGEVSFHSAIYEKDLNEVLIGVYGDLVSFEGDAAYDLKENITFLIDGEEAPDFWGISLADDPQRNLQKGQKKLLTIKQSGLKPGTYKTKILLKDLNDEPTDGQELELVVNVRHHIAYPITVIFLAVAFTFGVNVLLKNRRERIQIKSRLRQMDKEWLQDDPSAAASKVLATVNQVDKLSNRILIASNDLIGEKLTEADKLIGFLRQLRDIQHEIDRKPVELMRIRAEKRHRKLKEFLGQYELTGEREQEFTERLKILSGWFGPADEFEKAYTADLEADIKKLMLKMDPARFTELTQDANQSKEIGDFIQALTLHMNDVDATGNKQNIDAHKREKSYAALKVFWDQMESMSLEENERRQQREDLVNLIRGYHTSQDLDTLDLKLLFHKVDQKQFERVQNNQLEVTFKTPKSSVEAFTPVKFELDLEKEGLGEGYLFQYGLKYKWTITIYPRFNRGESIVLTPETQVPKVVQYIPYATKFKVEVMGINKSGDKIEIPAREFQSTPAVIFSLDKSLESSLIFATIASTVVAIFTGILTHYTGDPTFGDLKDYINLFLIGAGIDQSKNFLARMNTYAGKS